MCHHLAFIFLGAASTLSLLLGDPTMRSHGQILTSVAWLSWTQREGKGKQA